MKAKTRQERHSMALWEEVSAASETELKEEDGGDRDLLRSVDHYIVSCGNVCLLCTEHNCDF